MRGLGFRGLAILFALSWWIFPGFGLIDLSTTWDPGWPVVLEAGWGLLFTLFVGNAFVAIAVRPRRSGPAIAQLAVTALALAVSAIVGREPGALALAAAVAAEALIFVLVPGRERMEFKPFGVRRPLAAVVAAGVAPWCAYAWRMWEANRDGYAVDVTIGVDHYAVQGATALGIAALAGVAACWRRGRRMIGVSAGLTAAYLGLVSYAWPDTAAAYPRPWSALSIVWGIAVVVLSLAAPSARRPGGDAGDSGTQP